MPVEYELDIESWREAGACRDRDDVDFFPTPEDHDQITRAKAVCATCPVSDECLLFAIETNQPDGIWGGMTTAERVRLRRSWIKQAS